MGGPDFRTSGGVTRPSSSRPERNPPHGWTQTFIADNLHWGEEDISAGRRPPLEPVGLKRRIISHTGHKKGKEKRHYPLDGRGFSIWQILTGNRGA